MRADELDSYRRPDHLPKGAWGWIAEHILAIALLTAGAAAAALLIWAELIFG